MRTWSSRDVGKLATTVVLPALAGLGFIRAVPAIGAPIGGALRGDSTIASGAMAVLVLVVAAALGARSMVGQRRRWIYVAAAGAVLFGIAMIIVTFAASEAAELGVPQSMAGLSTLVGPIAPLALCVGALMELRTTWVDPYSRREAVRGAVLASVMLLLVLVLCPFGAARTTARPATQVRSSTSG